MNTRPLLYRTPKLNFTITIPPSLRQEWAENAHLQEKMRRVPTLFQDTLHPNKKAAPPFVEYVDENLWKSRIIYQPIAPQSPPHYTDPLPTLDALCEEELQRRFPGFQKIGGIKEAIKDEFPYLASWIMGKTWCMQNLTENEVAKLKKQISFSAINRKDLICTPTIEDPQLKKELRLTDESILRTEHIFAKNSPMNGRSFLRDGKPIYLTQGLASPSDRTVENTGNLRVIQTKNKESLCYAGRPDSDRKILEQASFMFLNEWKTTKKGITKTIDSQGNVVYNLDYILNSLLSAPWFYAFECPISEFPERTFIEDELQAIITLKNKGPITLDDPDHPGAKIQVKFNPIFFSRSLNALNRFEEWLPPFFTGASRAEEISEEGFKALKSLAKDKLTLSKNDSLNQQIKSTLDALERHVAQPYLEPEEELLFRDYLCKLLDLPCVYHCKSSLDRTSIPIAMSSTLHQWMQLQLPLPQDLRDLIKDPRFKELFAANWMTGHQVTRYCCNRKGTVAGEKLKTKTLGLTLHYGILQNPAIANLLPERYLTTYPSSEKIKIGCALAIPALLLSVVLFAITFFRHVAYILTPGKNKHWLGPKKFRLEHLGPTLIKNFGKIFPDKVLNEASPLVGQRKILKSH